ncbi:MAG: lamin tail domain-containing protein [Bacteroidota bacterium]
MKLFILTILTIVCLSSANAQVADFPYRESFDTVVIPSLPAGWKTSSNKNPAGDFITTTTSVRTSPNAVSSTDATRSQYLITPELNFTGKIPDSLEFFERRTSTHQARVLVEAAIGADTTFGIRISKDSLRFVSGSAYVRRSFALPETLSGHSAVRLRIRIIADSAGTTGVYRIDDIRITVKKQTDLSLTSLTILPLFPKQGERLMISAWIKNRAMAGVFSGSVTLYDSLELISQQILNRTFGLNDSQLVTFELPSISPGRHPLKMELFCNGDEDTSNNIVGSLVTAGYRRRTLLINEFMYLPSSGMPEWIEVINNSSFAIPMNGWKISDGGTTKAAISPTGSVVLPSEYCVITTDTNAFKLFYSDPVHLLQAQFSSLNNSGDAVVIFDPTNSAVDSLSYLSSWGGSTGRSLERVDTAAESSSPDNWRTSANILGATPGEINSVTRKQFDAAILRVTTDPLRPISENKCDAIVTIVNAGKEMLPNITVRLYIDINMDSLVTDDEFLQMKILAALQPGDSTFITFTIPPLDHGVHRIAAMLQTDHDDDPANNILFHSFTSGLPPYTVVITEILYAPSGDTPEWIEGYNRTSIAVNVSDWKISDNGTTKAMLTGGMMMVPPGSYFVVTTDTALFHTSYQADVQLFQAAFSSLNNTTPDAVVLYDERGGRMDSIYYRPTWGGLNGSSLQRFDNESSTADSSNWRSAQPSPGRENIIARKEFDAETGRVVCTRNSDGITIQTVVRNVGRKTIDGAAVRIYRNEQMKNSIQHDEVLYEQTLPSLVPFDSCAVSFLWKTLLHGKQQVTVVCSSAYDDRPENDTGRGTIALEFSEHTLVINEIMYEPLAGNAEFVELLNRSADTVDVSEWKLLDQPGSTGSRAVMQISDSCFLIPPNGFVTIASDSAFFDQFPEVDRSRILFRNSLSLSNSGEDLVLRDLTGTQMDSVRYSPQWHLPNAVSTGRSLERINPILSSNDGRNWSTSTVHRGATPQLTNSIYTSAVSVHSSLLLSPNPFSPDNDGIEDFLSINYTLPSVSSMIRIRIFDVTGRLIRHLVKNEPSSSTGTIIWNGMDDDGHTVRIGMYIILLEALDNFGGTPRTVKDVAVVARKL